MIKSAIYQERPLSQNRTLCLQNPYRTDILHPHTRAIRFLLKRIDEHLKTNVITLKEQSTFISLYGWDFELELDEDHVEVFLLLKFKDYNNGERVINFNSIKQIPDIINRIEEVEEYLDTYFSINRILNLNTEVFYEIGSPQSYLIGEEISIHKCLNEEGFEVFKIKTTTNNKVDYKKTTLSEFLLQYPFMKPFSIIPLNLLMTVELEEEMKIYAETCDSIFIDSK